MTDLFPNLVDLMATLPTSTAAARDAIELATAAREATTWNEVDDALDAVVDNWATP